MNQCLSWTVLVWYTELVKSTWVENRKVIAKKDKLNSVIISSIIIIIINDDVSNCSV
jgi:hypothetical protein